MFLRTLVMSIWAAVSLSASAAQTGYPMSDMNFALASGRVLVSGTIVKQGRSEQVAMAVNRAVIRGTLNSVDCNQRQPVCTGQLSVRNARVFLLITIDLDQDGNPDQPLANAPVGVVLPSGEIQFNVPTVATFVEDRYTFLEKMMGANDADFISLTLQL